MTYYIHPGSEAVSEFARQSNGVYLHGTCVETATLMIGVAAHRLAIAASQIGNTLQSMVNAWRVHNPAIGPDGSSSYVDATWWMESQWGLTVDANIAQNTDQCYQEMVTNLPHGYLYLIGTCDAQMLPGDEAGVHCHGLTAFGVDNNGNIICGDPDNAATQVHMPSNPVGNLVSYSLANFQAAGITSLTRVHPVTTAYDGYFQQISPTDWLCTKNNIHVTDAILAYWQGNNGIMRLPTHPVDYNLRNVVHDTSICVQQFEGGFILYDPARAFDNPPTMDPCYMPHMDDTRLGLVKAFPPIAVTVNGVAVPTPYSIIVNKV